jgi:hypothetical protein
MSWQHWIMNEQGTASHYDFLAELTVSSYGLNKKDRRQNKKDLVHFFVIWWTDNQENFIKHKTKSAFSKLLNVHWATVIHYQNNRKRSKLYEYNTLCIKDFLNS